MRSQGENGDVGPGGACVGGGAGAWMRARLYGRAHGRRGAPAEEREVRAGEGSKSGCWSGPNLRSAIAFTVGTCCTGRGGTTSAAGGSLRGSIFARGRQQHARLEVHGLRLGRNAQGAIESTKRGIEGKNECSAV